jgi:cysteine desulfurase
MGEAARLAAQGMAEESARLLALRQQFWEGIKDLEQVRINGHPDQRLPGALNISVAFVEGEALLMSLKDLALSTGSACTSASLEPSYVLRAIGLPDELAHSSLRLSFGRFTTAAEVDEAVRQLRHAVQTLRESSPQWRAYLHKGA